MHAFADGNPLHVDSTGARDLPPCVDSLPGEAPVGGRGPPLSAVSSLAAYLPVSPPTGS
ncbi:hypothetical protein [Jannaschia seohaensis]|uniref:hypothetical protein n=1 Tax=Jannaschia seohaensis TaxID=475081 RepID=UPI001474767A|nr:hypothetical protein [Jannaschia seohaensis]